MDNKAYIALIAISCILLFGCVNVAQNLLADSPLGLSGGNEIACRTGIYDGEGKCCEATCAKTCPTGYAPGTCKCQCNSQIAIERENAKNESQAGANDYGISGAFGDSGAIKPPAPE